MWLVKFKRQIANLKVNKKWLRKTNKVEVAVVIKRVKKLEKKFKKYNPDSSRLINKSCH